MTISLSILLIPLIAMQFTDEVNWTFRDFAIAGYIMAASGVLLEVLLRKVKNKLFLILSILLLAIIVILVWAELAVGIFGSSLAGT